MLHLAGMTQGQGLSHFTLKKIKQQQQKNAGRGGVEVELSHAGDRGSIPGRGRPRSLKSNDNSTAKRSATGSSEMTNIKHVTVGVAR